MPDIFVPPTRPDRSIIGQHYDAYRQIVELGGARVSEDPKAPFMISDRETWKDYPARPNMPTYLCDKGKAKYYFAEVGWPVLETHLLDDLRLLKHFADKPCIIKPIISAGSSTNVPVCYTIFDSARQALEAEPKPVFWVELAKSKNAIVQRSVAKQGEPFGQLHMEAIVNPQGDVFFSSSHEIEFQDARWTHQLPANPADDQQIEAIKQHIRDLVKLHSIKGCALSLQHVRSFEEGVWYPTDWQYRLTYNTVWGRRVFEPEYVGELVRFMTGQIDHVRIQSELHYYQKTVTVGVEDARQMRVAMAKHKIVYIPVNRSGTEMKFLFLSAGKTFEEAEQAMLAFEKEVGHV